jgi:hypothetical protein
MKIQVVSAFRNMSGRVPKYYQQVHALRVAFNSQVELGVVACTGDNEDRTREELLVLQKHFGVPTTIVDYSHGCRDWGSTEEGERLEKLSGVLNAALDGVAPDTDYVLYVESDLLWDPYQVHDLVAEVVRDPVTFPVVAPLVYAGEAFYDVWGFRGTDGERFAPFPPYHSSLKGLVDEECVVEVSSVGSCMVMAGVVARTVRCENGNALVGWCEAARAGGYRIGVAPHLRVDHPA